MKSASSWPLLADRLFTEEVLDFIATTGND
jgi:hypothetical protein